MGAGTNWVAMTDRVISEVARQGLIHHVADDDALDGRSIHLDGKPLINFALCSYLGLEMDVRLKRGAISAIERFGTQFAASRAYIAIALYEELEALLAEIFGGHVLVTPSTTLGHIAALPVLVGHNDAVILDQMVHNSVQTAAALLSGRGTHVESTPHSAVDKLEERIAALSRTHDRVWYLADGVYSMFGDAAPFADLHGLLDRYPRLQLYYDDAHGMSWTGPHGRGYALAARGIRDRMVVATSLCKAFSAGGGALVFPDAESRRKVRTCGGPMIFSGPVQPPMLGAAIASARIHLSDEIYSLQEALKERIELWNHLAFAYNLPQVAADATPIRFVKVGSNNAAYAVMKRLQAEGFYTNVSVFPIVPRQHAGIRLALTLHQTPTDIAQLAESLARNLQIVRDLDGVLENESRGLAGPAYAPAAPAPEVETGVALVSGIAPASGMPEYSTGVVTRF